MTYTACCLSDSSLTMPGFLTKAGANGYVWRMCCSRENRTSMADWKVMTDAEYYAAETWGIY